MYTYIHINTPIYIYIPTTSLCAEFLPLVLGTCISAANSNKRSWNQISAAGKFPFWSFGNICVGHAAVWWIHDQSHFSLLPASCLTLSFSGHPASLSVPLNLEMCFGFVTIQKGSLNVSKRYASALPSNLSNKVFWIWIVKYCWIHHQLTVFSSRNIEVSPVVHHGMKFRNHSKQIEILIEAVES